MRAFVIANYMVYILYIIAYFGIWRKAPEYLEYLRTVLKLYVGIVLILTFNPFIPLSSTGMSRQIAFSAGIFILTGLSLERIHNILNYLQVADVLDFVLPSLIF